MIANPCPSCRHHVDIRKVKSGRQGKFYKVYCPNCNIGLSKIYQDPVEMLAIWNALYP